MPKTILALDLANQTGWAVGHQGRVLKHGTQKLLQKTSESKGMPLIRLEKFLNDMVAAGVSLICFEDIKQSPKSVAAGHTFGRLSGVVMKFCEERNIDYCGINVGSWKKGLTGKGNANKDLIMDEITQLGFSVESQDEADAIGILFEAFNHAN